MRKKSFIYGLLVSFCLLAAPAKADNDTIVVDFLQGLDTFWVKTALKINKNLLYANCGIVNDVLANGFNAFWYSPNTMETNLKFGDKLEQTDTVPAFGAFQYDAAKIKKKLGNEYQWFVESYGTKEMIVRLRMFKRNDEGRLFLFKSGLLPQSITHEKPLKVYWDKAHPTMGIKQVYRIEPNEVPDSLQIAVTSGTSIYVSVEAELGAGDYLPLAEEVATAQQSPFGINLKEIREQKLAVYVTVRRGTEANITRLRFTQLEAYKEPDLPVDTVYTDVDTVACQGSTVIINGVSYVRNSIAIVYGERYVTSTAIHVPATRYHISFVTAPHTYDTIYVEEWPYTAEDGTQVTRQGWKHFTYPADNVCGQTIKSTYYILEEKQQEDLVYIPRRVNIDTTLCEGDIFELEGNYYTENGRAAYTEQIRSNDTMYIIATTYHLTFVPLQVVRDTVYVRSFPATYNNVTATKEGEVAVSVPADNPCHEIRQIYYFTMPVIDTVQRIVIDTLTCQGSVVRIGDKAFTTDTTFTLITEIDNRSYVEVSAITYNIEFEEQPVYFDTVYVAKLPAMVDGVRVDEEGWMMVEKPIQTVCLNAVYNHYVLIDHSIRWGSSCEYPISFEYGYDQWITDTLWFVCQVQELIDNGFAAYWNSIYDTDSLEISIFLNCESAPLETKVISFDRFYQISPEAIHNNYLAQIEARGIDINEIEVIGVRFVPRGMGELIVLRYGERSDHYIISETFITDTICDGQQYIIGDQIYTNSFKTSLSKRETNDLGTITYVNTTIYNITFVQTTIQRDTVYVESFPYVTSTGVKVERSGQMVMSWQEDDSACGYHQQHTTYLLKNAISITEMGATIRPTYAQAGQPIEIHAQGFNIVQVFDLLGRQVLNQQFEHNTEIQINQKGEYIVRIINNSNSGVQKVIIK